LKESFWLDERGSLLSWLALSLVLLILMMALLVDGGRYFLLKSRLLQTAEMGVILSSQLVDLKPVEEITPMVNMLVNAKMNATEGFLSVAHRDFTVNPLTIEINSETGFVSVGVSATLTPFFLKSLGIITGLNVQVTATASRQVKPHNIVLLLDGSTTADAAGALSGIKEAAEYFTLKLDKLNEDQNISLSLIPHMTRLINVASHKGWVRAGLWPDAVPPHVPGRALWSGYLEDQRWCVLPRSNPARRNPDLPSTALFDLEMEITVQTGADGVDEYSVTTINDCPKTPIHPLTPTVTSVVPAIQTLGAVGDFYPGRGMVWAGRILSPYWKGVWSNHTPQSRPKKRIIFMMVGGDPTGDADDRDDWKAACEMMSGQSVQIVAAGSKGAVDELKGGCPAGLIWYLGEDYKAAALWLLASLSEPVITHVE